MDSISKKYNNKKLSVAGNLASDAFSSSSDISGFGGDFGGGGGTANF